MSTVTLLEKIYSNSQLKLANRILKSKFKGLQVETKISGITSRGWIQIDISGEDAKVALHYFTDEIGLCPAHIDDVKKFSMIRGRVTALDKNRDELYVDIGVSSPKIIYAKIALQHLQAQLVDGRKLAFRKLGELFGLCKNLPLTVKILNIDKEKKHLTAMLSEKQLSQYGNWIKSLMDRLVILGSPDYELKLALKRAGLNRDVLNVEHLGLFEFALTCKLGTDAAGLIPKLGKNLQNATFTVFSPKKILQSLDYSTTFISL
ncbi:DUF2110 family protein [Candidatus Bathyarchaeota archaeon]|nr:DUF2110 family protein [Candidatus Bathyarchaeota archaeon]